MNDGKEHVVVVSPTKQSKIVLYKLEEDCINLKKLGLSYQKIADELNASGKVPANDPIDKFVVMRFLEKVPEVTRQVVRESKGRLVQVVNNNLDIIHEITTLFNDTKALLEGMKERAEENNGYIDPYRWKAVASEMREMLKQMTDIQREINDYNNIRKFMEIIMKVLEEEVPEKIPVIVDKLREVRNTKWFADIMNRGV